MPGALNLPFTKLVAADDVTHFRSPDELRAAFDEAGIVLGTSTLSYSSLSLHMDVSVSTVVYC